MEKAILGTKIGMTQLFNEDGKVDVLDAVMILRYEAGIIKSFKS